MKLMGVSFLIKLIKEKHVYITLGLLFIIIPTLAFIYNGKFFYGNFLWNLHISDVFIIEHLPKLISLGFEPFFTQGETTGWDAQFHYLMSYDPLLLSDEKLVGSYRHQRVLLSLLTWILAKLFGFHSVYFYFAIQYFVVFATTYYFAKYLTKHHISGYYALGFLCCFGTQMTLLNGLIDPIANALLLLSVLFCLERKLVLYMISMSMAVLSREVFVAVAFIFWGCFLYEKLDFKRLVQSIRLNIKAVILYSLPGVIFAAWQLYLFSIYGHFAHQTVEGIYGLPLLSFLQQTYLDFTYVDLLDTKRSILWIPLRFAHLFIVCTSFYLCLKLIKTEKIFLGILMLLVLSVSVGIVVTEHCYGYPKSVIFFYAFIPFALTRIEIRSKIQTMIKILFIFIIIGEICYFIMGRFYFGNTYHPILTKYDNISEVEITQDIQLVRVTPNIYQDNFVTGLFTPRYYAFDIVFAESLPKDAMLNVTFVTDAMENIATQSDEFWSYLNVNSVNATFRNIVYPPNGLDSKIKIRVKSNGKIIIQKILDLPDYNHLSAL
jgi:hypothetical protein